MDEARRRYEFKKTLEKLEAQEGDGTGLITLYIPPDKQIYDVTGHSRTSSASALTSRASRPGQTSRAPSPLSCQGSSPTSVHPQKVWRSFAVPSSSTATVPTSSARSSNRPSPSISTCTGAARSSSSSRSNRCLRKNMSMGFSCSTGARRTGDSCAATVSSRSVVPPPQYQAKCERAASRRPGSALREIAINEFYTKVGERSSAIFLAEKNFFERFKGLLIGGPSPTKEEFEAGNFLHHEVQKKSSDSLTSRTRMKTACPSSLTQQRTPFRVWRLSKRSPSWNGS